MKRNRIKIDLEFGIKSLAFQIKTAQQLCSVCHLSLGEFSFFSIESSIENRSIIEPARVEMNGKTAEIASHPNEKYSSLGKQLWFGCSLAVFNF